MKNIDWFYLPHFLDMVMNVLAFLGHKAITPDVKLSIKSNNGGDYYTIV